MRQASIKALTKFAVCAFVALSAAIAFAPQAHASLRGCPWDTFCIYPQNAHWNNNHPSLIYPMRFPGYGYGTPHTWHNLSNQYGVHKIFNNTYCYWVYLNTGYNGGGSHPLIVREGRSYDYNLTPINSITIWGDENLCNFHW